MRKLGAIFILAIILVLAAIVYYRGFRVNRATFVNSSLNSSTNTTIPVTISSPVFQNGQPIPKKYTCDDQGTNPPLQFSDVPKQTQSLALVIDDPDTAVGTWTHWLVWNIDPRATSIAENSVPTGAVQGQTSSGQNVYGGPCPPSGTHHYHFKLFALDGKLTIPSYSDISAFQQAINGHVISQAELVGVYSR
jgi:Raf kinase inhibitor-like YbhB/YbcL family protein